MKPIPQITLEEAHDELVELITRNDLPLPIPKKLETEDSITDEDIEIIANGYINQFINSRVLHFQFLLKNFIAEYLQETMGWVTEDKLKKTPVTVFKRCGKPKKPPQTEGDWLSDIGIVKW